jgi:hypothetical protein
MRRILKLAAVLTVVGCFGGGGDDGPTESDLNSPTCTQAMTHYYESGCAFFDEFGDQFSLPSMVSSCNQLVIDVPDRCRDEFDDFRECLDAVPANGADCDCSPEQEALLTCE